MTFSIAARCSRTGEFGCALATSSMAAGGRAIFVDPRAGVVLSQARSDPRLGTLAQQCLEAGRSARDTLSEVVGSTPHSAWRQLAVVDREGEVAEFTGSECTNAKGAVVAKAVVALGNGLANESVVAAMLTAFNSAPGRSLTDRLLSSLEGGLAAGGEAFPLRSAAIKVARPGVPFAPIDLRADCSATPIADLGHMWQLWAPMIDGYVQRCLDPANSPPAAAIEGHQLR